MPQRGQAAYVLVITKSMNLMPQSRSYWHLTSKTFLKIPIFGDG
jgi:hypothetical protein